MAFANVTLNTTGYTTVDGGSVTPYPATGLDITTSNALFNAVQRIQLSNSADSLTVTDTLTTSLLANFGQLGGGFVGIDFNGGNDTMTIDFLQADSARVKFTAGDGDDTFTISDFAVTRVDGPSGKLVLDMGAGADTLTLDNWDDTYRTDVLADGGVGAHDTFILDDPLTSYSFSKSQNGQDLLVTNRGVTNGVTVTVTNFESFMVGGTTYGSIDALIAAANGSGGGGTGGVFVDTTGFGGRGVNHPLPVNQGTLNAATHSPALRF